MPSRLLPSCAPLQARSPPISARASQIAPAAVKRSSRHWSRYTDAPTTAATSLAIVSSGAFTHFETHELIEASDLTAIAERAREIAYQPPGGWQTGRPADTAHGMNPARRRTG